MGTTSVVKVMRNFCECFQKWTMTVEETGLGGKFTKASLKLHSISDKGEMRITDNSQVISE